MSNHPASRGDYGIIGPHILIAFAVALIGFWPVMVVHGYTDTGGWQWDIHSTYAELTYLGTIGFVALMIWLGNRPAKLPPAPRDLEGSLRRAWEAVDESRRGGPREDLRSVAAGHEEQGGHLWDVTP
jgi:hypothetical protein